MKSREDGGQASVELALVLPLVALLLLVVVQVGLVVRDQVLVVHASREAARQAAVDRSDAAPRQAALRAAPLDPKRLTVTLSRLSGLDGRVLVRLKYRSETFVPVIGPLIPDVSLQGRAAMRREYD